MQIVDRTKLLPPAYGVGFTGVKCGSISSTLTPPACTDFLTAELGRLIMNPDNGAHTSFPIGKITVPDFVTDTGNDVINNVDNRVRDVVVITSEATQHFCSEFRHLTFMTDVSTEGRPQSIATAQVPASEVISATLAAGSARMRPMRSLARRSTRSWSSSRTSTPACAPSTSAIRITQ
jgi:hypothetical protein